MVRSARCESRSPRLVPIFLTRSRAIVCRPILATQNLLQGLCGEIHSCEALHLKWLPAKRQPRIKFNYATYNDQKESCRQMGASTPANSYYSILVQNNEDRTAIGHHRHRCRCCLLCGARRLCRGCIFVRETKQPAQKRRRRTQPQVTALPTSSLMPSSM
jgi:hypothetical protein